MTLPAEEGDRAMTEPAPGPAPLSPMFIWTSLQATRSELNIAVEKVAARVERLDEHGTRGVDALRVEMAQLRKDLGDHETVHEKAHKDQLDAARDAAAARRWLIGIIVSLTLPLYPFIGALIYLVVHHGR